MRVNALQIAAILAVSMAAPMPIPVERRVIPEPKRAASRSRYEPPLRSSLPSRDPFTPRPVNADKIAAADAKRARKNAARLRSVGPVA